MPNTQTTVNTATTTKTNKTFYDRNLMENAKTVLCHAKYGQKRNIPKNRGKKAEFRRWTAFDPRIALGGLQEGVTPNAQDLAQTSVEASLKQYGAYVEVSDLLKTTSYDDVVEAATDLLGEQLGTVVEWVTRDVMASGNNVQFANGNTNRVSLDDADKLTTTEIRKAVRTLKKNKAKPFRGEGRKPHFKCICSPDATYDLQNDPLWQDVSKYSDKEQVYSGEIGRLFGVVFIESTEAKVFSQSVLTAVASHVAGTAAVVVDEITLDAAAYLVSGAKIKIGATEYTVASCNVGTKTITLSATVGSAIAADTIVYSEDAGAIDAASKSGMDVHATMVFGRDAYGVIDVEGSGALQTIIKPLGSGEDPLNQRATIGAKVMAYTTVILNHEWLVRIEHGVSA